MYVDHFLRTDLCLCKLIPMNTTYLKYILPAISILIGMTLCVNYSLTQRDQGALWGGILMITAVSVALYAAFDSREEQ